MSHHSQAASSNADKNDNNNYNEEISDDLIYRGQVHGIKGLQSPSTYIVAVGFAFVLYHVNRTTDIPGLISAARGQARHFKDEYLMVTEEGSEEKLWNRYFIFALALVILSLVLAVKKVVSNRRQRQLQSKASLEAEAVGIMKQNYGIERINKEDYDYQTRYGTKAEIYKLVNSEAYQRTMKTKGADSSKWNWQVYDRQEGFLPKDVEEDKDA